MSDEDVLDATERLLGRFDFAAQLATLEREHRDQTQALLLSFIEVQDSLDRLFGNLEEEIESVSAKELARLKTLRLIGQQLEMALQKAGVTPIICLNRQCDPEKHVIVDVKQVPGVAEDTIVQEVFRGYEWNGEVLRLPHVIVAVGISQRLKEE